MKFLPSLLQLYGVCLIFVYSSHYEFDKFLSSLQAHSNYSCYFQALLLEKGFYPVRRIELMDCDIQFFSVTRLAKAFRVSNLVEVNFDYNEFGDEGCAGFCQGLKNNQVTMFCNIKRDYEVLYCVIAITPLCIRCEYIGAISYI